MLEVSPTEGYQGYQRGPGGGLSTYKEYVAKLLGSLSRKLHFPDGLSWSTVGTGHCPRAYSHAAPQ